jgi:N-acylneuraminate cytidylyltransferase
MVGKTICIIPARKNSKRIKNKNIILFDGNPMIYWTIKAAMKSKIFDRIVVSTDCEKIAKISKELGIEVPFLRNNNLADDFTPVSEVTLAALKQAEEHWNEDYDTVVQMMPNCPNRDEHITKDAFNYFNENACNFLLSSSKFVGLIPWWSLTIDKFNEPIYNFPEELNKRSQDLEDIYCITGALWIAKSQSLKKEKKFHGKSHKIYPMDWISAIDIDTLEDLKIAMIAREYKNKNAS